MSTPELHGDGTSSPETPDPSGSRSTFSVLEICLVDDITSIESEWRRLESREWNSLNQSLAWCSAWTQSQGTSLVALVGRIATRVVFILPLEIIREKAGRVARWPGRRFNNINTGLFDAEFPAANPEDAARLKSLISKSLYGVADLLVLDQVPLQWSGLRHPLAVLASVENQNPSFQLPLLASMDATIAQLNAKTRRKRFRSQYRKLEAIGGFEYICPDDPSEQRALLDLFFSQKGERLSTSGLPNVFSSPATRSFFARLLLAPARFPDTRLTMHAIRLKGEHEGHIAAITGLSRKGGHVLCEFGSIDTSIGADASPGELLFWMTIERSIGERATLFDFGVGDQAYKHSWCSRETTQHDILLPISLRGRVALPALLVATKLKAFLKRRPRIYSLVQRWRAGHQSD